MSRPVLSSAQTADANVSPTVQRLREPGVVLVDIRSAQEIADAPYTGSLKIVFAVVTVDNQDAMNEEFLTANEIDKEETPIVVFCRSGRRAGFAVKALEGLGVKRAVNGGGLTDLVAACTEAGV